MRTVYLDGLQAAEAVRQRQLDAAHATELATASRSHVRQAEQIHAALGRLKEGNAHSQSPPQLDFQGESLIEWL